ncbi:transposase, partial [Shewanella sp. 10N.286.45.A1]
ERVHQPKGIAFSLKDYLILVDETGRVIRDDKRGAISSSAEAILNRLNIPAANWIKIVAEFGQLFHGPVGTLEEFSRYCEHLNKRRRHFSSSCEYMQNH